jgi:NADH-quinone oxidoreductase subunit N
MTFYLVVYIVTSLMAFGVIAVLSDPKKEFEELNDYLGLFHQNRGPAIVMALALISLASLPPTGGLVGKIFLAAAGVQSSLWVLLAALVIGSVVGLFYYLRVAITIFRNPEGETPPWSAPPISRFANATLVVLSIGLLILGIFPSPLMQVIQSVVVHLGG